MTFDDDLAAHATVLLRAHAAGDVSAGPAFDELLYRALVSYVRGRADWLVTDARRLVRQGGVTIPKVPPADLDALAADVTLDALARAKRTADRFDPDRGDGLTWAMGAAALSWVDVVRRQYGTRRQVQELLLGDEELALVAPPAPPEHGPEQRAEQIAAVDRALSVLTADERFVVVAKYQYGLTYREIALRLFGSPDAEKRVDNALQSARKKLADAEARWRADDAGEGAS